MEDTVRSCLVTENCLVCGGRLIERRLKKHCETCGSLCETCCDNGQP